MEGKDNIQHTSTALNWLEKVLEMAKKYTFINWIEGFLVIFITFVMVVCFTHPDKVLNFFVESAQDKHTELMEQRQQNNNQVQMAIDKFLYRNDADRIMVCELHNGSNSISGVPFLKATATFEAIADTVLPVANQYQQVNLSLFPFANFLYDEGFWCGKTEEVKQIDKPLMYRMLGNSTEQFAACTISGRTKTIGFIFVSFDRADIIDEVVLKREMQKLSVELGVLLELRNN